MYLQAEVLQPGRIQMSDVESSALDFLIAANADQPISVTRRDPGDSGPLVAQVGDAQYEIDEAGNLTTAATRDVEEQIHG